MLEDLGPADLRTFDQMVEAARVQAGVELDAQIAQLTDQAATNEVAVRNELKRQQEKALKRQQEQYDLKLQQLAEQQQQQQQQFDLQLQQFQQQLAAQQANEQRSQEQTDSGKCSSIFSNSRRHSNKQSSKLHRKGSRSNMPLSS